MVYAVVGVVTLLLPHLANKVVVNVCLNEPCSLIPQVECGPCIYCMLLHTSSSAFILLSGRICSFVTI